MGNHIVICPYSGNSQNNKKVTTNTQNKTVLSFKNAKCEVRYKKSCAI